MKFSIIIPACNEEKYIEKTLKSIPRNQEIIVVCNGCIDLTEKIAKKYSKVISIKEKNVSIAKNLGAKISIVTDGINGSYAIDRSGEVYKLGAVSQEKPRERTGAGDSYATGFMYGILTGRSISDAMRYGAINAESVIREIGAQKGLLTKEEIEQESREFEEFTAQKLWLI